MKKMKAAKLMDEEIFSRAEWVQKRPTMKTVHRKPFLQIINLFQG